MHIIAKMVWIGVSKMANLFFVSYTHKLHTLELC